VQGRARAVRGARGRFDQTGGGSGGRSSVVVVVRACAVWAVPAVASGQLGPRTRLHVRTREVSVL
jgi:hypothetical protein